MIRLLLPLLAGFGIDCLLGDPHSLPHPVVLIGKTISALERALRKMFPKTPRGERAAGAVLWGIVSVLAAAIPAMILCACEKVSPWLRLAVESVMCWQILAARSLRDERMKVYRELEHGSIESSRRAVSMIVGRDTAALDDAGVTRSAVETIAENTSDGVVAPLLYLAVGGAPLGFFYKAVNTMDSMLGYVEPPYKNIGFVSEGGRYCKLSARAPIRAADACSRWDPAHGRQKRLEDFSPRPLSARKPELRTDGVGLRGAFGGAACRRCVVSRRAAQKRAHRRCAAPDHARGHPARLPADVRHNSFGAAAWLRGESAYFFAVRETHAVRKRKLPWRRYLCGRRAP